MWDNNVIFHNGKPRGPHPYDAHSAYIWCPISGRMLEVRFSGMWQVAGPTYVNYMGFCLPVYSEEQKEYICGVR